MRRKGRVLSTLLAVLLLTSIMPPPAYAAEAPWAENAVTELNLIYGGGFTADDEPVTVDAVRTLLTTQFGYAEEEAEEFAVGESGENFTRLQLSRLVCRLYGLKANGQAFPDCGDAAVLTLRGLGIVSGNIDGNFLPAGTVTNAELAVIFYRAMNASGAGGGTSRIEGIQPGMYGYDEVMYLWARKCMQNLYSISPDVVLNESTKINVDGTEETGGEDILSAWMRRLESCGDGGDRDWPAAEEPPGTLLEAIVLTAQADRDAFDDEHRGIFSDVPPGHWAYQGVMYLFNKGIVNGAGDGTFGVDPESEKLSRANMAVVICRAANIDVEESADTNMDAITDREDIGEYAQSSVLHALDGDYMILDAENNFRPNDNVTREEAAKAAFGLFGEYDPSDVNLNVLDRFNDKDDVGEGYETAMAYLVSAGIINGTYEEEIAPGSDVTRAMFGVLLARAMMGLDTSRMHDYMSAVEEVFE